MASEDITDTHCHIIDRGALRYPWLTNVPALDRDWPLAAYQEEARRAGITRTLHMEVDVAEDQIDAETRHITGLATAGDAMICGVIAACRPEHVNFPDQIAAAQAQPLVKGFRRALHVVPDGVSQQSLFRKNMRQLANTGLPFDLCVTARQLPIAQALVDAAPHTQFVLDHCGVPDIASGGWENWAGAIAELAHRDNLSVKISGLPAYAATRWRPADLRGWVLHVIDHFGPARCVWGGDWPVCTLGGSLSDWVGATYAILAPFSADERAAIFRRNAARLWDI